MNINRNNCEAFFLDYHEGRLHPLQVSELLLFLEKHSDLKQVFESFENISLEEETIFFSAKDSLKKSPNSELLTPNSFEEICVADVEGEISSAQKKKLSAIIASNSSLKKEYELYHKTKLVPEAIIFENKFLLKKQVRRQFVANHYYVAAAASVLLMIGLFFLLSTNSENKKAKVLSSNKTVLPAVPEIRILSGINNKNNIVPPDERKNTFVVQSKIKENKIFFSETNRKPQTAKNIIVPEKQKQDEPQLVNNIEKKEQPKLPEIKKEEAPIVIAENKKPKTNNQPACPVGRQLTTDEEYLSLKEVVTSTIKTKLLADELPEQELKGDNYKKFKLWDVAVFVTKSVRKLTGKDINVGRKYDKNNQVTVSSLHIGNFSVEHTVATR